jgi:hypothetical protein
MKLETAQTDAQGDDYAGQELMQEEFSLQHGHGQSRPENYRATLALYGIPRREWL